MGGGLFEVKQTKNNLFYADVYVFVGLCRNLGRCGTMPTTSNR